MVCLIVVLIFLVFACLLILKANFLRLLFIAGGSSRYVRVLMSGHKILGVTQVYLCPLMGLTQRDFMKFNIGVCCDKCDCTTHCRLPLFNQPPQPWAFRCAACGSVFEITMNSNEDISKVVTQVRGASKVFERWI